MLGAGGVSNLSLNEINGIANKAARGAGMAWGLAEEAGKAARWLALRRLPALPLLADHLEANDGRDYAALRPVDEAGVWRSPSGHLCPLVVGCALLDRRLDLAEGRVVETGAIAHPLLLLPAVARAVDEAPLALAWKGVDLWVGPQGLFVRGGDLSPAASPWSRCGPAPADPPAAPSLPPRDGPVPVDETTLARLAALALRTYVPASAVSRKGAGAGTGDND